jgi:hypothetical protein
MIGKRYTIWLLKIIQRFEIGAKNKVVLFSKMIKEHRTGPNTSNVSPNRRNWTKEARRNGKLLDLTKTT